MEAHTREKKSPINPHHKRLILTASYASIIMALLLIILKSMAWLATGSASILGSLMDSLMDAGASLINLFAVNYALKPADDEHRFGHGKAESIAAVAQSAFVAGTGLLLLLYCIEQLVSPVPAEVINTSIGMWVIIFTIVATLVLITFQRYVIKKTGSQVVKADSLHYVADILMNTSVLFALWCSYMGWLYWDLIIGMVIGVYIMYGAWGLLKEALDTLMDKELPDDIVAQIKAIALDEPEVFGIHGVRPRQSGLTYVIQMHLEMDDNTILKDSHDIAERVEKRIEEAFPNSDIIIHQDPLSIVEKASPIVE